jgi:tetratricopeptide (TPR) repeat protein
MTGSEENNAAIQLMISQDRHEDAITALEKWVAETDDVGPAHNHLGSLYLEKGKTDQALAHYQKAADQNPDNPEYLKNLADILYSATPDVERALAVYDKILDLRPDDVKTLMIAGHIRVSLKRFGDAMKHYTRILGLEPSNEDAKQYLDRIKYHTGDPENESIPTAAYQRCQELVAQGRLNEGIACLERLTRQHPEFALAYNDLGVLYYQQGDKARCVSSYQKAVEMDPRNPIFKKNLADFCLVEEESVEKALEIYASVLNDNPEDIDALMVAGHICSMLGNNDSARTFYERILDIEPWNFDAGEGIEKLSVRQLPKSNSSNDINLLPAN